MDLLVPNSLGSAPCITSDWIHCCSLCRASAVLQVLSGYRDYLDRQSDATESLKRERERIATFFVTHELHSDATAPGALQDLTGKWDEALDDFSSNGGGNGAGSVTPDLRNSAAGLQYDDVDQEWLRHVAQRDPRAYLDALVRPRRETREVSMLVLA